MKITIEAAHDGKVLKNYLRYDLRFSHAMISKLKKTDNGILLNGLHATVRAFLCGGDTLELAAEDFENDVNNNIEPADLPFDILYEDDYILIVNKNPNMPPHPSLYHQNDTLANAVVFYYRSQNVPFVFRAVNRLDSGTSGIMMIAKSKPAAYAFYTLMSRNEINKEYTAIVKNKPNPLQGDIISQIRRKEDSLILREVCCLYNYETPRQNDNETSIPNGCEISFSDKKSLYAHTKYKTILSKNGYSVLNVKTLTGRTHQIRVHLSSVGCPIIGDYLYGSDDDNFALNHQALHAGNISFIHPYTGKNMDIFAPLPQDMKNIIDNLL